MVRAFAWLALFVITTTFALSDEIQPYGGLDWNDGFFQVLKKLQKLPGVTRVVIGKEGELSVMSPKGIDVSGVSSPDDLAKLLLGILEDPNTGNTINLQEDGDIIGQWLVPFINAQGANDHYESLPWFGNVLRAGPVYLEGHPFEVSVVFKCEPGFACQFPDRCLFFSEHKIGIIPYAIQSVNLDTDSSLSEDVKNKVLGVLTSKYGAPTDKHFLDEGLPVTLPKDAANPKIVLCFGHGANDVFIHYVFDPRRDLQEAYRSHVSSVAERGGQDKPNGVGGL